jgi:phage N-6-adenine-methyltransferase
MASTGAVQSPACERSLRDCWATPPSFFAGLTRRFNFDLDVCAQPDTAKCPLFFTPAEDGLRQSWAGRRCYANPPYSDIESWAAKAWHEAGRGALVAMLVPPRTDSRWWHRYAIRASEWLWVMGRVRFVPPPDIKQSTPCEPSVVIVWGSSRSCYPTSISIDPVTGLKVIEPPQPEQLSLTGGKP